MFAAITALSSLNGSTLIPLPLAAFQMAK